jgi:hypothetical protein
MSAIDFAARLAGVPQQTIDEVNAAAPHTARLLQTFKDHEDLIVQGKALLDKFGPVIAEAMPLIAQAQAFYAKVSPLIGPALKEIDAITPAVKDVLAFIKSQQPDPSQPAPGSQF